VLLPRIVLRTGLIEVVGKVFPLLVGNFGEFDQFVNEVEKLALGSGMERTHEKRESDPWLPKTLKAVISPDFLSLLERTGSLLSEENSLFTFQNSLFHLVGNSHRKPKESKAFSAASRPVGGRNCGNSLYFS
jgi:hypothetical protein